VILRFPSEPSIFALGASWRKFLVIFQPIGQGRS
jgi:hypothetical protein